MDEKAFWERFERLKAEGLNLFLPDRLENHQRGYICVPVRVLYDQDLSPLARLLYCCLLSLDYADKETHRRKRKVWPSQGLLAAMLGCSGRTVRRCIDELEERRYIMTENRGRGNSLVYHLGLTVSGKKVLDTRVGFLVLAGVPVEAEDAEVKSADTGVQLFKSADTGVHSVRTLVSTE